MAIVKATELAAAPSYPSNRLCPRERKVLEVSNSFVPALTASWAVAPATQDAALNSIVDCNIGQKFKTVSALFDFATLGGAVGAISLGVILPIKAIVVEVVSDVVTSPTSTGSTGTLQLNVPTDGNLAASMTANGSGALAFHDPNTASSVLPKKLTAARTLQVTVATAAVTAGKVRYHVRYYQGE